MTAMATTIVVATWACAKQPAQTIDPRPLVVLTETLGPATVGLELHGFLQAYGGAPPYEWTTETASGSAPVELSAAGEFRITPVHAGTLRLNFRVTDSQKNSVGAAYDLLVLPATGSCELPLSLSATISGLVYVEGTLPTDLRPSDSDCVGGEVATFYSLELAQRSRVWLSQRGATGVSVVETCPNSAPAGACEIGTATVLESGRHLVALSGARGAAYKLEAHFEPMPRATCEVPLLIEFDRGYARISGTFDGAGDSFSVSCQPGQEEVVYRFETTSVSDLDIEPVSRDSGFATLSIRDEDCRSGIERLCDARGGRTSVRNLPAGRHFLVVERAYAHAVEFAYNLNLFGSQPLAGHQTCETADMLSFRPGAEGVEVASALFDFRGVMASTLQGLCPPVRAVYFAFDLDRPSEVMVSSSAKVGLFNADCTARTDVSCAAPTGDACPGVLPAGRYVARAALLDEFEEQHYISITRRAAVRQEAPPNDGCSAAAAIDLGSGSATLSGQLEHAANDLARAGVPCAQGPDVFYRLHLDQRTDLAVSFDLHHLHATLLDSCASAKALCPGPSFLGIGPGEFVLAVSREVEPIESCGLSLFPFTMQITSSPSAVPPTNDQCSGATQLVFRDHVAHVSGSVVGAATDMWERGCPSVTYSRPFGADIFFGFDLEQTSRVRVRGTDAVSGPLVALLSTCGDLASIACEPDLSGDGVVLRPGHHLLAVWSRTSTFALDIEAAPGL